jgi:hypothetical protein
VPGPLEAEPLDLHYQAEPSNESRVKSKIKNRINLPNWQHDRPIVLDNLFANQIKAAYKLAALSFQSRGLTVKRGWFLRSKLS